MTDDFKVLKQIAALEGKSVNDLTKLWGTFYDYEPMSYSKSYLVSKIAYKIQELPMADSQWKPENAWIICLQTSKAAS